MFMILSGLVFGWGVHFVYSVATNALMRRAKRNRVFVHKPTDHEYMTTVAIAKALYGDKL